jgi:putative hemolysin
VPKAADKFKWQGFEFEVMDMDGNRVDKVLVHQSEKVPETE